MTKQISQQKIAKDLGVSQALVSMVLNGRRSGISESSYQKIWDHALKMGYRPKGMVLTEAEKNKETRRTVGMIFREGIKLYNQSPFFEHVQQGLHERLMAHECSLVYLGTEKHLDTDSFRQFLEKEGSLRGLVIFGEVGRTFLAAMKQLQPRIVSISAQFPGYCHSLTFNEQQAAELMVAHLCGLGHTSFAWLGGNCGGQRCKSRKRSLLDALQLRGIRLDPAHVVELKGGERLHGRQAAEQLLDVTAGTPLPGAWVCYNGLMARGVANTLLKSGISIPGDVSLSTFDNTSVCEEDQPTLTGACASAEDIGAKAADLILNSSGDLNETLSDIVLPASLVVRESTGPSLSGKNVST